MAHVAWAQPEAAYIYYLHTAQFSEQAEKTIQSALVDRDGMVRMEAARAARSVKMLSDLPIPVDEILSACSAASIAPVRLVEVNSGQVLYEDLDRPLAEGERPDLSPLTPSALGEAKRRFLEANPDWRRTHPATDQDSSPEE